MSTRTGTIRIFSMLFLILSFFVLATTSYADTNNDNWFNPDWKYRKEITIDNSNNPNALTDYQINLNLTPSNFDFSKTLPGGDDIVFTDTDGITTLNSWVENYSQTGAPGETYQEVGQYPSRSNTTGWWHLDNSLADSSGNGNTGVLTGLSFDHNGLDNEGASSYFSAADTNDTLDGTASFTVEAWAKPSSLPASGKFATILGKGGPGNDGTGTDHNYYLLIANNMASFGLTGVQGVVFGFENALGTNYNVSYPVTLDTTTWHHFVGVFDSVGKTLKLYMDGVLVATQSSVTATPNVQNEPLYIGSLTLTNPEAPTGVFSGHIDEVRILNTILDATAIAEDYTASQPASFTTPPGDPSGSIWVKIPSIPANTTKKIYLYYGLDSAPNFKMGLITDAHGITDFLNAYGDKVGTHTIADIGEFTTRMNNIVHPDVSIDMGDRINNVNHDTDLAATQAIAAAFQNLNSPMYHVLGNHDPKNLTKAEIQTALGTNYNYTSADVNGYHLVILDGQEGSAGADGGHISDTQLNWLTADLAATTLPTMIFIHQGLGDEAAGLNAYFAGNPNLIKVDNSAAVRTILENSHKVIAVIQGHSHWENMRTINGIPYIWVGSLVEGDGDKWAEMSIYDHRYMDIMFHAKGNETNHLMWDLVDKKWFNDGSQTFKLFDNFNGDSGQWSALPGAATGKWDIDLGPGTLEEKLNTTTPDRILKSTYLEDPNYIAQMQYNTNSGADTGGFATRITSSTNFAALYPSTTGNYFGWKQRLNNIWTTVKTDSTYGASNNDWHTLKMVKVGDTYSLYNDGSLKLTATNNALSDGYFGIWNYDHEMNFDNLFIREYTPVEPTTQIGQEEIFIANQAPTANAGNSQSITYPTNTITLDATASTDTDGTITSYLWSRTSGSGTITNTNKATTTVTGLTVGTSIFKLVVTDNSGATSTDSVTITVNKGTPTISWNTPSPITQGTALSAAQLNATTTIAGTFVYNPTTGTVLSSGNQTLSTTFTPTDSGNWNNATKSVILVVNTDNSTSTTTPTTPVDNQVDKGMIPLAFLQQLNTYNAQLANQSCTITISSVTTPCISSNNNTIENPIYEDSSNQTSNPIFTHDLKLGMTDNDVQALQIYLNTHGYPVATSGAGSPGNETNYFGTLTQKALIKYQTDHKISPNVGYFGPITRNSMND